MRNTREANYVIISAVRDEEKYVETTIESVVKQTAKPSRWILVDDGSRDKTPSIIARYSKLYPWITLITADHKANREPGRGVIRAFKTGYETIENADFDFIVKLDCDLKLPPDYFQLLVARFQQDERLGIASGIYLEHGALGWSPVKMPAYHAAGASKMVRVKCFEDIHGFVVARGWDTLDEIRAQMLGWRTRHFPELEFYHLKGEGSAIGLLRTSMNYGQSYYLTGGGALFFLLKVLQRAVRGKPLFLNGLMMAFGYIKAWLSEEQLLVNKAEATFYRQQLNGRIVACISRLFSVTKLKGRARYST